MADTPDHLRDALDALECMVFQYLPDKPDDPDCRFYGHSFMSAGEYATGVLARLRPERWKETPCGLEYVGPMDYEGMYEDV